jgi:hypothetical protein
MADRIFPNKFQESGLDSELVFTGINWDTFNERLAAAKDGESDSKVPHELLDALNEKYPGAFDEEARSNDKEGNSKYSTYAEDTEDTEDAESNYSNKKSMYAAYAEDDEDSEDEDEDEDESDEDESEEDEEDEEEESEMEKRASKLIFTHPSQLSAEAVEAAIAAGDTRFANTILAARHERRVRLATQIETNIKTAQAHQTALNQRKAYRENLVKVASKNERRTAVAQKTAEPTFVKASTLNNNSKKAFAAKAIAAGFPAEYVEAMLNTPAAESPKVAEIKQVMASNLNNNIKKQVVASIVKEASLDAANINRCKDYWKNELGYGDPEWVDELFDSKN